MQENHSNKTLWRAVRCLAVLILGISMCAIQYNTFTKDANTFGRSSHFRKLRHAPNGVGSAVRGLGTGLTAAADIELARNIRPLMQLKDAIISGDSAVQAQCLRELDTITDAATRERLIGLTNEAAKAGDSDNAFRSRLVSAGFEAMDSSEAIGNFNNYHTMNRAVAENLKNQEDAAKRIADGNLKMERDPNNPNIVTMDGPTVAALGRSGKLEMDDPGYTDTPDGGARVDISKMDPEFQEAFSKVCDDYFSRPGTAAPAQSAAPAQPAAPAAPAPGKDLSAVRDTLPTTDVGLGKGVTSTPLSVMHPICQGVHYV